MIDWLLRPITRRLDRIEAVLALYRKKEEALMAALDDLTAQVTAQTTVEQSAITLLNQLSDLIKQAGTDPVKLAALTAQLKTSADALAAAIVANTPAAPPA